MTPKLPAPLPHRSAGRARSSSPTLRPTQRATRLGWVAGLLLLSGCGSLASFDNSLSMHEYKALQCQTQIASIVETLGSQGTIHQHQVDNPPACPAAGQATYTESLKNSLGKGAAQATIICRGEHHAPAGYPTDYPRYQPGSGVTTNPEGLHQAPRSLGLTLPEDAKVTASGGQQGSVFVTFTTSTPLEPLATGYYKMLNNGQDPILSGSVVESGVGGKLAGISYAVSFNPEKQSVTIGWEPPIIDR